MPPPKDVFTMCSVSAEGNFVTNDILGCVKVVTEKLNVFSNIGKYTLQHFLSCLGKGNVNVCVA